MEKPISPSTDEVDFAVVANNNYANNNNHIMNNNTKLSENNNSQHYVPQEGSENVPKSPNAKPCQQVAANGGPPPTPAVRANKKKVTESNCSGSGEPKKNSTKERLSLFSFGRRSASAPKFGAGEKAPSESICQPAKPISAFGTPPRPQKFVRGSTSLARLLGNTYNARKFEKEEQKRRAASSGDEVTKFNTFGGRRRAAGSPYLEHFKRCAKEDDDLPIETRAICTSVGGSGSGSGSGSGNGGELVCLDHFQEGAAAAHRHEDLGAKAMRTISRSLGKLWWRRTHSVEISTPDPEFKVSYLGNVLTGWAKGEGCVEKQLSTLWRNYTQNTKPDVIMRIKVCASGLKATTRQHGLTEYWANRITHCCAPKNYPRVFCWIYRHEGRKLKHELRCHAVLCSKEKIVHDICEMLKENLERALREFKRDKILKQNARLSLANAADDNPSLPRRKILLSVGGNNYRPPLERSKSAPKLMAIEEAIGEEDGEEIEETNEPEMKPCCQKDSLYPAMTLGRRRCRRGHSIRRTGQTRPCFGDTLPRASSLAKGKDHQHQHVDGCCNAVKSTKEDAVPPALSPAACEDGSDDSDDFEKLLQYNNYDSSVSLANELLPYFDMQLHKNTSASLGSLSELKDYVEEPLSLNPAINSDPSAALDADFDAGVHRDGLDDDAIGLRRNGVCSDGEEDYLDADDLYFRQASLLNMLHRNSMRKMTNMSLSSGDESSIETSASATLPYRHHMQSSISSDASSTAASSSSSGAHACQPQQQQTHPSDSDEGSISSGCETASTVTANQDDLSLQYRGQQSATTLLRNHALALSAGVGDEDQQQELDESPQPITVEEIYQRLESRLQKRHNSDATTFSSSSSITLKLGGQSPTTSTNGLDGVGLGTGVGNAGSGSGSTRSRRTCHQSAQQAVAGSDGGGGDGGGDDSESDCSDESGYVEFQERDSHKATSELLSGDVGGAVVVGRHIQNPQQKVLKPQLPPKPMPRRINATGATTAV